MDQQLPPEMPEPPMPAPASEAFRFTGNGGDYFRIWIVNLLLTVLTLGIYSAWAKVRRLQYFYQHTELAGSRFDYHGNPLSILKGRVIALLLVLAYNFSFNISLIVGLVTVLVIALAFPWLLRNSLRFRAHYSSYRGLRFSFRGSLADAYITFLGYGILAFVSLYIVAPLFHQRLKRYQHGNARFGSLAFGFDASVGSFYRVYAITGLVTIGAFAVVAVLLGGSFAGVQAALQGRDANVVGVVIAVLGVAVLVLIGQFIGPLFSALSGNLIWNHTRLGEHRFESRLSPWQLLWIGLSNTVLVMITLGLFMPWAAVRLARYRAECMSLITATSLDAVVADVEQGIGAVGEEATELFDIDIGL
jgi:uncharacterized membrane protein YjgN (DUF898 family)